MRLDPSDISRQCSTASAPYIEAAFQRLYPLANQDLPASVYIFDLVGQCNLYCNTSLYDLLGYDVAPLPAPGGWDTANLIHPDHLDAVADHYQRLGSLGGEAVISLDYQMRRPDGEWCWVRSHETALVESSQGFPTQIMGMTQILEHPQRPSVTRHRTREVQRLINQVFQTFPSSHSAGTSTGWQK